MKWGIFKSSGQRVDVSRAPGEKKNEKKWKVPIHPSQQCGTGENGKHVIVIWSYRRRANHSTGRPMSRHETRLAEGSE